MRMFESFNKNSGGGNLNGWQSLGRERQAPLEKEKSPEELLAERESRIVNTLMTGDPAKLREKDPTDAPEDRQAVLDGIKDGRITKMYWDRTLEQVPGPLDEKSTEEVFAGMSRDRHARRILSSLTGLGFYAVGAVNSDTLMNFAEKYPSPTDFEKDSNDFLAMIRESNPGSKYQEYVESMDRFKHQVYGEKQDYWDAAKELIAEAETEVSPEDPLENVELYEDVPERERLSRERQARKLIGALATGDRRVIGQPDFPATLSQLESVYDRINNGQVSARDWDSIISNIRSPMMEYSPVGLMDRIQGDDRKLMILSRMSGKGFRGTPDLSDMLNFTKAYDTPIKFDFVSQQMLKTLEMSVNATEYQKCAEAMSEFKRDMYGKQQEYWDAAKRIEKAASDYRKNGNRHPYDDAYGPDDPSNPFHEVR